MMTPERIDQLISVYRDGLLHETLPFWIDHCVDREHGGFMTCLDRDGTVIDTDKGMWQQGRFTWLLAWLYKRVEPRDEWLELARHGIDFIRRFGFDKDGRMFFQVTRDGRPVRKRRYVFTESFAAAALAAYAGAAGDEAAGEEAADLLELVHDHLVTPGLIPPKIEPETRPMRGMAGPMVMITTSQIVRSVVNDPIYDQWIDEAIDEIETYLMKPELEAVMEIVGPEGELIDHFDGRMLNPGHAIETAWFILEEARHRGGDARLVKIGTTILDWMWKRGWDEEYGGILYFRDVKGLPVQEYWQDMKFWWPHCEAIIATLLAYHLTGDSRYAAWHEKVHDWAYAHFPDRTHGEWFGYLHRDGRVSVTLKGNLWKGPFHLPRMQCHCWQLLKEMKG
jgi:N-acylglucosamine 2-epimerase